jgi:hypothetical protein
MISAEKTEEEFWFEKAFGDAMIDVATELRLTDLNELIMMIGTGQSANIADLVDSSTELYFRRGSLRYALHAECSVRWQVTPVVKFDVEFRHEHVCAFFRLVIGENQAGIEIQDVLFDESGLAPGQRYERLVAALDDARL